MVLSEITKLPVKPLKNIIPSGSCIPRTPFHDRMEDVAQENGIKLKNENPTLSA